MFNDKLVVNESESAGCYFRIPPQGRLEEAKVKAGTVALQPRSEDCDVCIQV